jgi:hypothetical protein
MTDWTFYGRDQELKDILRILQRGRWFFCQISGRRRIGKTTLIREALARMPGRRRAFYVQIPDSDERGVVQAFRDALEDHFPEELHFEEVRSFSDLADVVEKLCRDDDIVVLDEFQYFHRKALSPFASFLQARVDRLRDSQAGGLFVLGSIHTEMTALLEDRASPLFNRITDRIRLGHWDFRTLFEMWHEHGIDEPRHQLFLWTLFEGVPKFYRDSFDQAVLSEIDDYRTETIRRLFFEGSSPLRDEADNWFLRELRGRYDSVLKILADKGPCDHGTLTAEYRDIGTGDAKQLGGYLQALIDRYEMVERQLPVFAARNARRSRYAITDNFLSAWLSSLARNVARSRVQPVDECVERAQAMLLVHEGGTFEKMVRHLVEECSRRQVDFRVSDIVRGYWNKPDGSDVEIDLVAINDDERVVTFGSCKRSEERHGSQELEAFREHVRRFQRTKEGQRISGYDLRYCLFSPRFSTTRRESLTAGGYMCRDLSDYREILLPAA